LRLAIHYQLYLSGTKVTTDAALYLDNKRTRLQSLIEIFQHQADFFILRHSHVGDSTISYMYAYDLYDDVGYSDMTRPTGPEHPYASSDQLSSLPQDGSEMDSLNPEDLLILLPSSLGWKWCVAHDVHSLATKDAWLYISQANESIHWIHLALGF
jgi:hypothetical protein